MSKLTHYDLIKVGSLLGYNSMTGGLCHGFSCMWAQALLAEDEEYFFNRLNLIASYKTNFNALITDCEKAKKKVRQFRQLTQQDIDLLEIPAFFDGTTMYLRPYDHPDLFNRGYLSQDDLQTLYPFIQSKKLEHTNLSILFNKSHSFDKASLKAFLRDLEEPLKKAALEFPILLSNAGHSVCLKYSKTKQKWIYVDTNDFSRYPDTETYFRELETTELVSSLFDSLSHSSAANVLFNMKVLSADNQTPELDAIKVSLTELALNYPVTTEVATACDSRQLGLLFLACHKGDLTLVQTLLKNPQIKINHTGSNWTTPLYTACQNGHFAVVTELLKHPEILINQGRNGGTPPLYIACQNGHLDIVAELLKQPGILINQADSDESTALYIACEKGHHAVVAELLKQPNLLINRSDSERTTPLYIACADGHLTVVTQLLKQPMIEINKALNDGTTPLYIACQNNHLTVVAELLKQPDILINQADSDGATALHIACQNGQLDIVVELLKQPDILINQAKNNGVTPLYLACQNGHLSVVELLLKTPGVDIHSRGLTNHTPLLVACLSPHTQNNEKLFQWLLDNKASLCHKNDKGQTALDIAFEQNNTAALSVLLKFIRIYSMTPSKLMSLSSLEKALDWTKVQCPEVAKYLATSQSTGRSIKFFTEPTKIDSSNDESLAPRQGQ